MAAMTRLEPGTPSLRTANLTRLARLAEELTKRGLPAHLVAPEGRFPRLVVAPEATQTSAGVEPIEDAEPAAGTGPAEVYAWRCQDRSWWYWWPWAERIGSDTDLELTAARIERELARRRVAAAADGAGAERIAL
jgi:hypothetical protein